MIQLNFPQVLISAIENSVRKTQTHHPTLLGLRQSGQFLVKTAVTPHIIQLCSPKETDIPATQSYKSFVGGIV